MPLAQVAAVLALAAAGSTVDVRPAPTGSGPGAPVEFRLRDQFGGEHDAADYRGHPLYLVGAGRAGRGSATAWVLALAPALARTTHSSDAAVVPVANLRGAPRWLRGFVRSRFPSDRASMVLLDWDGALSDRMAFDGERCTIVVVDADGRPVLRTTTLVADSTQITGFVGRAAIALGRDTLPLP